MPGTNWKHMPKRDVAFVAGEYYHVFNRGANRQPIFRTADNYRFLLGRITESVKACQVSIIAYCLMPNHYHFLLRQNSECLVTHVTQSGQPHPPPPLPKR